MIKKAQSGRFFVMVPARMASGRLPGKPLLDLLGVPMVIRVAQQAQKSHAERVIIVTDHPAIEQVCHDYQVECCMTRVDHTSGTDRLAEAVAALRLETEEIIINVQGDEPLIAPELIDQLAEHMIATHTEMATLAHPIHDKQDMFNPNIVKVVLNQLGQALYFSRAPIPYARDAFFEKQTNLPDDFPVLRHIGMYAYRAGFLQRYAALEPVAIEQFESLEQLRALWYGHTVSVMVTDQAPVAGVDIPDDVKRVIECLRKQAG